MKDWLKSHIKLRQEGRLHVSQFGNAWLSHGPNGCHERESGRSHLEWALQRHWEYEAVRVIAKAGTDVKELATGQLTDMHQGPLRNPQICSQEKELALVIHQTTKSMNPEQINRPFPGFSSFLPLSLQSWGFASKVGRCWQKNSFFSFFSPSRFPDPGRLNVGEYSLLPYFKV